MKNVNIGSLTFYIIEGLQNLNDSFIMTDPSDEKYTEFQRDMRIVRLSINLIEMGETTFDWKALARDGQLCQRDFDDEYFAKQLKEIGYENYEQYSKEYSERNN